MKGRILKLKRVYDSAETSDGFRILVDRLWPRGIEKEKAKIDLWLKDIAPSDQLRKWFGHIPAKWIKFAERYKEELKKNRNTVMKLKEELKKHKVVTLVFGAKDEKYNNAVALKKLLSL